MTRDVQRARVNRNKHPDYETLIFNLDSNVVNNELDLIQIVYCLRDGTDPQLSHFLVIPVNKSLILLMYRMFCH